MDHKEILIEKKCTEQWDDYSSLISNVELQLWIYKRLALIPLVHMAQDNWLVDSTCAL